LLTRLKLALATLLVLGVVASAGLFAHQALAGRPDEDKPPAGGTQEAKPPEARAPRTDRYGDPLPDGAVARLGTVRWRHPGEGCGLVFSPDGKLLVSQCSGGELLLWDTATGNVLRRLHPPSRDRFASGFGGPDFTPDGRTLAARTSTGDVSFLDVASGKQVRTLSAPQGKGGGGDLPYLRLSPDGKIAAVATDDDEVFLLNAGTGEVLHRIGGHRAAVYGLAFSPDGKSLALGTLNPSVQLWDMAAGKLVLGIEEPDDRFVMAVAFSPDGKTIAAGSWDRIILSDAATGKEVGRLVAEKMESLNGLAFTPDGKTLVSGSQDGKVRVWDLDTRKARFTLDGHGWIGRSMALSRDGKTVALGTVYDAIRLWDVGTGKELFTEFEGHDAPVHCVAFTPDGKTLVSGGDNVQTRLWDVATWKQTGQLKASARMVSFTPDGKRMATIAYNKTVRVWDVPGETYRGEMRDPDKRTVHVGKVGTEQDAFKLELPDTDDIKQARFAPDGKTLVSVDWRRNAGNDRSLGITRLVVWDAAAGKRLRQMALAEVIPASLALTPDGRTAVVGDGEGIIHLFDLEEGKEFLALRGHQHYVDALALSADGKTLVSGSYDRGVRLWDLVSGQQIALLEGHKRAVAAVAFSPDGRLAASAGGSRSYPYDVTDPRRIRLWDVVSGKEVVHFEGHTADVTSLAFSPDGARLVSGLMDSTILVWDVAALPRQPALEVRADEVDGLWKDLAGADAFKAHQAVWRLAATPEKTVPFLKEHVPAAAEVDAEKVRRWIADLDSEEFAVRAAAVKELERLGDRAAPALREALAGKPSAEVRKQAEELLASLRLVRSPEVLQRLRAVQVLERIGSPEARRLLEALARGAPAARETREAKASLERLAERPTP
jgi:WD40 repeat protein